MSSAFLSEEDITPLLYNKIYISNISIICGHGTKIKGRMIEKYIIIQIVIRDNLINDLTFRLWANLCNNFCPLQILSRKNLLYSTDEF